MKKYLSILLALMLVNITLIIVNPTDVKAEDQQQTSNVDVVIVIDNSGSMNMATYHNGTYSNTTKWEDAVEAASQFIDQLQPGDQCAIFCFENNNGSNVTYDYQNGTYSNGWKYQKPRLLRGFESTSSSGKSTLKKDLEELSPDFGTPLFDTIGAAMDYISYNKRSNSVGAIVALTDGEDNENAKFYPSHNYREYKEVAEAGYNQSRYGLLNFTEATFIIGLGITDYSNYKTQLQNVANSSDGEYYSTSDSSKLGAIYDQIAQQIDEKRDDNDKGSEESFLDQWLLPLIIIIIAIIVVAVLLAVLLRKNKTPPYAQRPVGGYQQQPQQQQQQTQPPAAGVCPTCGKPTRFIQQYNRYWCDSCQQYK